MRDVDKILSYQKVIALAYSKLGLAQSCMAQGFLAAERRMREWSTSASLNFGKKRE